MEKITSLDLRFNIAALTLAICHDDYLTPEASFYYLETFRKKILTDQDGEDIYRLINVYGETQVNVSKMYGVSNRTINIINKRKKLSQAAT